MTMTTPSPAYQAVDRHERIYRRLLIVYPRDFRDEYGEDLVQGFRDLMVFATDGRGVWWRTARDLISSAVKERGSMFSRDRKPSIGVVFVLLALLVVTLGAGSASGALLPYILVFMVAMIALPTYGLTRFRRAWLVRRTTGAKVTRHVARGVGSFVPAAGFLVLFKDDAGYLIFVSVALTLIVGGAMVLVWVVVTLITSGRDLLARRR